MRTMSVVVVVALAGAACDKKDAAHGAKAEVSASADVSAAEYAALLIAELKKHGGKPGLHFEADKSLVTDGELQVSITNIYAEYLKAPVADRPAALAQVVTTFSSLPGERTLAEVRGKLLPVVRAGLYFDWELQNKLKTPVKSPSTAVFRPIGELTGAAIGIDEPTSMEIATDKQLTAWHLSIEDALAIGIANLAAKGTKFELARPGVWTSPAHDNYDASRLLLVDQIKKLGIKGTIVAVIPNRDTIYLASAQDPKALLAMADLAQKASAEPRPIHTVPLCLAEATWSECEPAPTPEVKARMHDLAVDGLGSLYADQHDSLQDKVGDDLFVAKLSVMQDKATKRLDSYATWTRTVPTLLPRADKIAFVELAGDSAENAKVIGMVPWDKVMSVVGSHLTSDGRTPPRWGTGDYYPTAADFAKLDPKPIVPKP